MNLYDYIKKDHAKVSSLFQKFENSTELSEKKNIVKNIAQELLVHLEAERETFYDVLCQHLSTKPLVKHGVVEHKEIELYIISVLYAPRHDRTWHNDVLKLKSTVEHHVEEEESKIHAAAQTVLSEDEAENIKIEMQSLKKEIKKRIQQILNF